MNELKIALKEVVTEVVQREIMKLNASLLPYVSDAEQEEIEELYKKSNNDITKVL